jgi:hypothetical protein
MNMQMNGMLDGSDSIGPDEIAVINNPLGG